MAKYEMIEGKRVKVKLYGDDAWYEGIVLDRPRKMWVELINYHRPFIADESNIEVWEYV
jgi:hypothetical protein